MTQTVETLFDTGLERYKAGESAETLIPVFKEICDRAPKNSAAWTCLAWLYLLNDKATAAFKAAQKAVKLNPQDPQARINLAVAMLETGQKGLREHVDFAHQLIFVNPDWQEEIKSSIEDGLSRKPDWQSLIKVKGWLFSK
ncbi:tetratricopeptide repeat protein [Scytonema sp. UIC 10036]|uniref:tetratricopeptide repeat protein n=1 Tax=Scytonema sp. UIC 10036 TaxID=2304196 RepID=UPI0012DADA22|nr:tetratricopeptide repeat protein [Scytonema sp. UIC 10036]MUG99716.1 tetratricopeptide repeat protein [Scytonema sp. UIC 10036]